MSERISPESTGLYFRSYSTKSFGPHLQGVVCSVKVIVVGNGDGDQSSKPGGNCLHFTKR